MQKEPETKVERSRLTLLLGLTSTAAAAGCNTTRSPVGPELEELNNETAEVLGGEGGEGGGGGSH